MGAEILVRYGELALKSPPVRREFESTLRRNILDQFQRAGETCRLRSDHGHLYVDAEDEVRALRLLRRVFGVTSVSAVVEVPTDQAGIERTLLTLADPKLPSGCSFAVRARRTGQHSFTSQELARDLGAAVLSRWPERELRVDLDAPAVELFVEVRGPRTYLYLDRQAGPGGLPLGVAGRVVCLVDGVRGALGAYLMMKRGCRPGFVLTTTGAPLYDRVLREFDPKAPHIAAEGHEGSSENSIESMAESISADGIVLPLTVEEYPQARERWGDRVIFSPTVAFDADEVEARWHVVEQLAG